LASRRDLLDKANAKLSFRRQCRLLNLSRSSVYRPKAQERESNLQLMRQIDRIYTERPFYGVLRMTDALREQGFHVSHNRVRRLIRKMGLISVLPKPYTTHPRQDKGFKKYPYLLSEMVISRPNQVWCADITYIPLRRGFAYLVAILDWHSRTVLSFRISNTLDSRFCLEALAEALKKFGRPDIFNTDQGCQFTSDSFTGMLQEQGIKISWDSRGRAVDNIIVERFWWTLKYEHVFLHEAETVWEVQKSISTYLKWYNESRKHSSLGKRTPWEVYNTQPAALAA
jgi:putative transposase